jgi:hypothetical protein
MGMFYSNAILRLSPLPVSGLSVILRPLTGTEDQLLLEALDSNISLALALLSHTAKLANNEIPDGGARSDWSKLSVTDLDILILRLRQMVFGNDIRTDVSCGTAQCCQRIDISFGIDEYIAHHAPAPVQGNNREWRVEPAEESGWFRLLDNRASKDSDLRDEDDVFFRLPTVADQLAVRGLPDAAEALARRCIRPIALADEKRLQVEALMESMAPSLSNELRGACPECEAEVNVYFDVRHYCLRELKEHATFVYEDIDTLARRYHWAEADILALPQNRRTIYAELARREGD